ncbi:oxygen-independent coproporphyrinogen III oxidase [Thorsellia anophelis]|uniref:Coproporphyrinogen-III oxidase n=1 Tax=Thorsellia anophelis DSM 18579 TaxID=1123402 RepID=A0A1I0CBT5_9GAMM|nr:oxygen-independent coproporphyrinogen III oxidase [Thorsellia anophelis]SET16437.1 oxygen-independent coproporphyrinogen-3 oxidase [Thorsellia anophelis DSM 18579]
MPELILPTSLIAKMDKPGPRYTSYPTADKFTDAYTFTQHQETLKMLGSNYHNEPISLYFHIPFCQSVCFYCACNKVITMHQHRADEYFMHLIKEIDLTTQLISKRLTVSQIHFGGGTPTYMTDEQLEAILIHVRKKFDVTRDVECSIEIDPRTVNYDRLNRLDDIGFNRISIGVQDFDGDVQKAVHRVQPFRQVAEIFLTAKKLAIESINVDMIYGLPKQTPETFAQSLETLIDLKPDRIALYAYAHLPERFKPQRRIITEELPTSEQRLTMLGMAIEQLTKAGWDYIGMDHFALPTDSLAIAKREGKLQRNFQGYSTHAKTDLIGFGVSAISLINGNYSQNQRELIAYEDALANHQLPSFRGYASDADDLLRYTIIMQIMCQGKISFSEINKEFDIDFLNYFKHELLSLDDLITEGLCYYDDEQLVVTNRGWFLVRGIAMRFDKHLQNRLDTQTRFSKII